MCRSVSGSSDYPALDSSASIGKRYLGTMNWAYHSVSRLTSIHPKMAPSHCGRGTALSKSEPHKRTFSEPSGISLTMQKLGTACSRGSSSSSVRLETTKLGLFNGKADYLQRILDGTRAGSVAVEVDSMTFPASHYWPIDVDQIWAESFLP
ncbi:uncharacterized protein ATNIH1004_001123 [Aspergillus tanneri]|uniref:Uncharacterized protein n=1 Tax=Aspergillus tanneri TaxID=1220188 RepID=A0A5M9N599_9EURO|nr:uncharacterized protein ATNIH1004_001123 [Aspergillus tanneri]KAA8652219.1 hypothetical protein ATNIH1004_001123 [Aspergillus tanneri]